MTLNNWWTDIDTYNSNHGTKSHEYILNGMCMAEVIKFKGQRELDSNPRSITVRFIEVTRQEPEKYIVMYV